MTDPGAKMMSAIATMIDANDPNEIEKIIATIDDPAIIDEIAADLAALGYPHK